MAGKYFEEFEVGQTFVHEIRRTVDRHGQHLIFRTDL